MISVIIPYHDEAKNLEELVTRLEKVVKKIKGKEFEFIFVDDGSTDNPPKLPDTIAGFRLKHTRLRLQTGKGRALIVALNRSKGDTLVFMDADLQDDPADLPLFLAKIDEGFEFVNGWRKDRQDGLNKTLPSSIFNTLLLKIVLKSPYHDANCGFKAMSREVLEEITLYGDNYRFLPIFAAQSGFKVAEVEVHHSPRVHGESKYGFWRILTGSFDTLTTYFLYKYSEKPLQFFGAVGGFLFFIGFIFTSWLVYDRLFNGILLYRRPALLAGVMLLIIGVQIIMTGIVAELQVFFYKKLKKTIIED